MSSSAVTPDDVLELTKPTNGFLCSLADNQYDLEFINFTISDYDTKNIIFEVGKDLPPPQDMTLDFSSLGEDMYRKIKYTFSEDVLRLPFIQTSLIFSVGNREVHDFRMIERHYFRNKVIALNKHCSPFPSPHPNIVNTWDAVYSVPALSEELIEDMIANPFETQSDSFYFVDNCLVMHNKASYQYLKEDTGAQSKKSYEHKFGSKGAKGASKAAKKGVKEETYLDEDEDDVNTSEDMKAEAKGAYGGGRSAKVAKEVVWSKEEDYF